MRLNMLIIYARAYWPQLVAGVTWLANVNRGCALVMAIVLLSGHWPEYQTSFYRDLAILMLSVEWARWLTAGLPGALVRLRKGGPNDKVISQ